MVDTSAWIHQMRPRGNATVRDRVERLLESGEAAWCAMIRLEIWAGVRNENERGALRDYAAVIPELPIDEVVWQVAYDLAGLARQVGKTVPASDILIFSCAQHHGIEIEHADAHFDMLAQLRP